MDKLKKNKPQTIESKNNLNKQLNINKKESSKTSRRDGKRRSLKKETDIAIAGVVITDYPWFNDFSLCCSRRFQSQKNLQRNVQGRCIDHRI